MARLFWVGAAAAGALYGAGWLYARRQARRAERDLPATGNFVAVEGVRLHYVRRGSGPPVVLLHGSDGFLQDYSLTVLDRLAMDYDVIAVDRPGHGYSELPAGEQATAPAQARLLRAALRRIGIERPLLVGHSWSALLMLYYAWKYPDDAAGLVLLAPWVYPGRFGEPFLRIVSNVWISRLVHPLLAPFKHWVVRHYLEQAFTPDPIPDEYRRQAETLWLRSPGLLAATARENSGIRSALGDFSPDKVSPSIPIVIVVGAGDRVTPPEQQADRLRSELPHARLDLLPVAGHELPHTAPDEVLRGIETCLSLIAGPAPGKQVGVPAHDRARDLVMRFGWNSAAYQILNPEIEHWFTDDGEACVGFVTWGGVRVVAGSPICTEERLVEVAAEFERDASKSGERVCYFGAAERLRNALATLPTHSVLPIGAQPAWNPAGWQAILTSNRSLRAQLNRARNKGVTVVEWPGAQALDPRLERCFDEWNRAHAGLSLHFLTEPVAMDRLGDRRLFVAERAGEPVGFLVATPVPERRGWLVEQIVRGSAAPNGTAELLIDGLLRQLADEGSGYVTLGLAPLSRRGGVAPARRLWLRLLLTWIRAHGARFYNFEGLDAFKGKFQPDTWEPIFAISNEPRFSARTLYGVAAAFTEGAPLTAIAGAIVSAVQQEWSWLRRREPTEKSATEAVPRVSKTL